MLTIVMLAVAGDALAQERLASLAGVDLVRVTTVDPSAPLPELDGDVIPLRSTEPFVATSRYGAARRAESGVAHGILLGGVIGAVAAGTCLVGGCDSVVLLAVPYGAGIGGVAGLLGRSESRWWNALLGGVGGAIVGAGIALGHTNGDLRDDGAAPAVGAILGAPLGMIVGAARDPRSESPEMPPVSPTEVSAGGSGTAAYLILSPGQTIMASGGSVRLRATPYNSVGAVVPANIAWSSSDDAIASVSGSGQVTAHAEGTVVITVRAGSAVATARITVGIPR